MKRRLLNLLTVLSLVLFLAVCVLWLRSYQVGDTYTRLPAARIEAVQSADGRLRREGGRGDGKGERREGGRETLLTTLPELDHFRSRADAGGAYWGPALSRAAPGETEAPRWPADDGRRVFAYLKASAAAEDVLRELKRAGCPTVTYVDGMTEATRLRLQAPTLQVETKRVDVARASRECDLALLNGGHGLTAEMLLADNR